MGRPGHTKAFSAKTARILNLKSSQASKESIFIW